MKNGIACPECGCTAQSVLETRRQEGAIYRRRKCFDCKAAFNTEERATECIKRDSNEKAKDRVFLYAKLSHAILELRQVQQIIDRGCTEMADPGVRETGGTTRMVEEAVELLKSGETVYICAPSQEVARFIMGLPALRSFVATESIPKNLKLITLHNGKTMLMGQGRGGVMFIDNSVYGQPGLRQLVDVARVRGIEICWSYVW